MKFEFESGLVVEILAFQPVYSNEITRRIELRNHELFIEAHLLYFCIKIEKSESPINFLIGSCKENKS